MGQTNELHPYGKLMANEWNCIRKWMELKPTFWVAIWHWFSRRSSWCCCWWVSKAIEAESRVRSVNVGGNEWYSLVSVSTMADILLKAHWTSPSLSRSWYFIRGETQRQRCCWLHENGPELSSLDRWTSQSEIRKFKLLRKFDWKRN